MSTKRTTKPKARAPRPVPGGQAEAKEATQKATTVFELAVRGEVAGRLAIGNTPFSEKMAVRNQVGMTWSDLIGARGVGLDVVNWTVFVWLARRATGEPDLRWSTFLQFWDNTVTAADIDCIAIADETPAGGEDSDGNGTAVDELEDADPQP